MARDLTPAAAANLAAGAVDGPGTDVCAACSGPKEPTRLNSARCRACGAGGLGASTSTAPTRTIRAALPVDIAERFAAEAAARQMQPNEFLAHLVTVRDAKKYGASPSTAPSNRK